MFGSAGAHVEADPVQQLSVGLSQLELFSDPALIHKKSGLFSACVNNCEPQVRQKRRVTDCPESAEMVN